MKLNKLRIILATLVLVFGLSACGTNPQVEQRSNQRPQQAKYDTKVLYQKGMSAYKVGNNSEAYKLLLDAAEQGHPKAQLEIGNFYYNGEFVLRDFKKAASWYELSAKQGVAQAQYKFGVLNFIGLGLIPIYDKNNEFKRWKVAGFESSNKQLQNTLGAQGIPRDSAKAFYWFNKAAKQGYAAAQYKVGFMNYYDLDVSKNLSEAFNWFKLSATQGYAKAQFELGQMYYKGEAVTRDYSSALKWFTLSADKQNEEAQLYLGLMYERGYGVLQNCQKADYWFRLSADQGHIKAKMNLMLMHCRELHTR